MNNNEKIKEIHYSYIPVKETSTAEAARTIDSLETLRASAYGYNPDVSDTPLNYYSVQLYKGKLISIAAFYEGKPVAGIYLSKMDNNLMIDQVFVAPEYQGTGACFGQQIVEYVLEHIEEIEVLLGTSFEGTVFSPVNEKAKKLARTLGYKKRENDAYGLYYKGI